MTYPFCFIQKSNKQDNTKESAAELAKLSSQLALISPGLSTDDAQKGLVSVAKAYSVEVDDITRKILDNINIVGNNFATSNAEIITGLQKSSAAMAAMGSSLEENIGLFTAGQTIIQDASTVGNAIRSISLRVRSFDEETEQLSEDLVNIKGEVVELTKVASNNYQGISLFTDETQTEYKSIYEYLKEISEIFDELEAKPRQELLEKLFGKNRASVGAAILSQMSVATDAIKTMEQAEGSAAREIEVMQDSISFAINKFKETLTSIAQSNITRDFLKGIIDQATKFLEVFEKSEVTLKPVFSLLQGAITIVTDLTKTFGALGTTIGLIATKNALSGTGRDRMFSLTNEYARCDVVVTLNKLCA